MKEKALKVLSLLDTIVDEFAEESSELTMEIFRNTPRLDVLMESKVPTIESLNFHIRRKLGEDISKRNRNINFIRLNTMRLDKIFITIDGKYLDIDKVLTSFLLLSLKLASRVNKLDIVRDGNISLMFDSIISVLEACITINRNLVIGQPITSLNSS